MANSNLAYQYDPEYYPEAPHVRRAFIPPEAMLYENMSELGQELYRLSMEIAASGEGLLTEKELERELVRRKGGYLSEDK